MLAKPMVLLFLIQTLLVSCKTGESAQLLDADAKGGSSDLGTIPVGDNGVVTVECTPTTDNEPDSYPVNGVTTTVANGRSDFTIKYLPLVAHSGVARQCSANLPMTVPAGWQFSLVRADLNVVNNLVPDTRAAVEVIFRVNEQFGRQSDHGSIASGVTQASYKFNENIATNSFYWSPCNVNSSPNFLFSYNIPRGANGEPTNGTLTMGDAKFYFAWKQCSSN